jgi:hypothetical protein
VSFVPLFYFTSLEGRKTHRWQMPNEPNVTIADQTNLTTAAVKAVGDWELDVLAIPFGSRDSDKQEFDGDTDVMPDVFQTPLIVYQHGISQGAKGYQEKPIVVGKAVAGSLNKQADGWHIRVILDKAVSLAKNIMDAAWKGLVAVSSGSISHLARLEVGGKMQMYQKDKPGRIAVWPLAEVSLWELGNGNVQPANRFAVALPAMKAIYRDAGIPFPDIQTTDGVSPEASLDAALRARSKDAVKQAKLILKHTAKYVGEQNV